MSYCMLLSLLVAAGGGQAQEKTFDHTEHVRGFSHVSVKLQIADLKVIADRSDDVSIHISRKVSGGTAEQRRWWLETPRYEARTHGDTFSVEEVMPKNQDDRRWGGKNFHMDVKAELHVPARMALNLGTGVGTIEASKLEGSLSLVTGAGSVKLKDLMNRREAVEVTTGAGTIELSGRMGDIQARTGAGNVIGKGISCEGREVKIETGAGRIDVDFDRVPSGNLSVNSGVGSVNVNLPQKARVISDSRERDNDRRHYGPGNLGGTLVGEIGRTRVTVSSGIGALHVTSNR